MRRVVSFLLALVFCFSLACTVSANSPGQGGTPSVSGGNVWYQGSNGNLALQLPAGVTEENVKDSGVEVNGNKLTEGVDYTISVDANGNVIITLTNEYLSKLPVGTYTMTVAGKTITFVVTKAGVIWGNPKTGDMANMQLWVPMMIASALALAAVVFVYFKKFRKV